MVSWHLQALNGGNSLADCLGGEVTEAIGLLCRQAATLRSLAGRVHLPLFCSSRQAAIAQERTLLARWRKLPLPKNYSAVVALRENAVELHEHLDEVKDSATFPSFARALAATKANNDGWENTTIETFLDAPSPGRKIATLA